MACCSSVSSVGVVVVAMSQLWHKGAARGATTTGPGALGGVGRKQRIVRSTSQGPDAAIARIADRQHGNVTREQLFGLGLSRDRIDDRIQLGRLHVVHRAVYSVGRPPKTALERAAAAVLAGGADALLSHHSAIALWGLAPWRQLIHITVPTDRRPRGVKVHRVRGLIGRDRRTHQGIRVTSPARTLLDCAPHLRENALTRAFNDAWRARLVKPESIADVVQRFPCHPGARRVKQFIEVKGGPTRSAWEDGFPVFCKRYGLPEPLMCTHVAGYEVDALFAAERLIVELDSWSFHSDPEAFESDRDRDADTLAADHETVRITWARIEHRPAREAARLHRILELRRRHVAA